MLIVSQLRVFCMNNKKRIINMIPRTEKETIELIQLMAQVGATVPQVEAELNLPYQSVAKNKKFTQAYITGRKNLYKVIDDFIEKKAKEAEDGEIQ